MEFRVEALIPRLPQSVWSVFVDIPRIASCIPGCEDVVERAYLADYSAVLKQKLGPFKLSLPAEIKVEEVNEPHRLKARATGRDKLTATQITVSLLIELTEQADAQSLLTVSADMQVVGKLATLGYAVIKKKTEENFEEFKRLLLKQLEATTTATAAPKAEASTAAPEAEASQAGARDAPVPVTPAVQAHSSDSTTLATPGETEQSAQADSASAPVNSGIPVAPVPDSHIADAENEGAAVHPSRSELPVSLIFETHSNVDKSL